MDTTNTLEGTISLHRCAGCTFQVVRAPGEFIGHYRLTRDSRSLRSAPRT